MQNKKLTQAVKATISSIIVALFITGALILVIYLFLGQEIGKVFSLVNKVSITIDENRTQEQTTIGETNKLKNYPEYGTKYATIEIDKIGVNLPVYFGDTLEVLKKIGRAHV